MPPVEFSVSNTVDNLFSSAANENRIKERLTVQSITVEGLQISRYMYDDGEEFVSKRFSLYCNLLRQFGQFDESLKISFFKVLLKGTEKLLTSLDGVLKSSTSELDENVCLKYRNLIRKCVYLLCEMTFAFEKVLAKKAETENAAKGRKKKASPEDDVSEWLDERPSFLNITNKIFQKPIQKFWSPHLVEFELINYVSTTHFKLLENPQIVKDKSLKKDIFIFLGHILLENQTGLAYSIKTLQMVQDHEHLGAVMAEAVIYFVEECRDDVFITTIFREAARLDEKALVQNVNAAHSLSTLLVTVAEKFPKKVLNIMSSLLELLNWESHVMRNTVITIIGTVVSKVLTYENLSEKDQEIREELLDYIEQRLLDVNSFVRSKCIQVLKGLMDETVLSSSELYVYGKLISKRLYDKASNVRKNAMTFLAQFIHVNQFACQIPLPVLKESHQKEYHKLKEMKKSLPMRFEDSFRDDEGAEKETCPEAVVFDSDEDDKEMSNDKPTEQPPENEVINDVNTEEEGNDEPDKELLEAYEKQKTFVNYLKNTLNFAEVIHGLAEPVSALLNSATQTDVLEAMDFFASASGNLAGSAGFGTKHILSLVWAKEPTVRSAAFNTFKSLYLPTAQKKSDAVKIAENLIEIHKDSTPDDEVNLQAYIKHFCKMGDIPDIVSSILWNNFVNSSGAPEEDKFIILSLLGMIAEEQPSFIMQNIDSLIQYGMGEAAEKNFQLALYAFRSFRKANQLKRGNCVKLSESMLEVRLPNHHHITDRLKYFLVDGIQNFNDDKWTPMADEAVGLIFCLVEDPIMLCSEINKMLNERFFYNKSISEDETVDVPNIILARFASFCGYVAIHYMRFMRVDYFGVLRRQELEREKRRRRSSIGNITLTGTPQSPLGNGVTPLRSAMKKKMNKKQEYQLVPPTAEDTTYAQVLEKCANEVSNENTLIGSLYKITATICQMSFNEYDKAVQAASSLALVKFMLLSEQVCADQIQLIVTVTNKSPEPYIRANLVMAFSDLITSYPNVIEPWTPQVFQRLKDPDAYVREVAIISLSQLIMNDFVRVKSLISDAAKCIADTEDSVAIVAKFLFTELAKKSTVLTNIIPDIISTLSNPASEVSEDQFQAVLGHILQYIEKDKVVETLVEKLCCRFTTSSTDIQLYELTFCLSILTLNAKCYSKLIEFKTLLKERMGDPIIVKYMTAVAANAKKNDAKTASELEAFRRELDI